MIEMPAPRALKIVDALLTTQFNVSALTLSEYKKLRALEASLLHTINAAVLSHDDTHLLYSLAK